MLAKSILFTGLLVGSFSVFVNAKNSDTNFDYSGSENQQNGPNDEAFFPRVTTEDERDEFLRIFLFDYKKFATQNLIKDIVELTNKYTFDQLERIFTDIIIASKGNSLERPICLKILKEAINRIDTDQMRQQKLKRLKVLSLRPRIPEEDLAPMPLPNFLLDFPTADERLRIIKEILLEHNKSASEPLIQEVVEHTEYLEMSVFRNGVITMVKEFNLSSLEQERYLERPTSDERLEAVKEILLLAEKSAPESLIQDIAKLTECYDIRTVRKLVKSMVKESKTDSLDRNSCIAILRKAINLLDEDEIKEFKLAQIKTITTKESLTKTGEEQK